MNNTESKVVVITGAASGMGKELAHQYAEQGYALALADLSIESLISVQQEAERLGAAEVMCQVVDVANESQVNQFADDVNTKFSRVDVVINNAGITRMGTFEGSSPEAFRQIIDVNFWGVVYGSRAFLPALKKTAGTLTNISSLFGLIGVPGQTAYCASKFAVRGFTESLRQEVQQFGVHVACVHPGGISTNIARNAVFDENSDSREETLERIESKSLVMPASKAAGIIRNGIDKRKDRILIGRDAKTLDYVARLFPTFYSKLLSKFMPAED